MLVGNHRGHNPQVRVGGGISCGERLELAFEHVHMGAQGAQTAQTEGWIRLVFRSEERQRLVGAGVEHTNHDLLARELAQQLGVSAGLLFDGRRLGVADEQEFSTEQANTLSAIFQRLGRIGRLAHVGEQRNQMTILGGARIAAQFLGCGRTGLGGFGNGDLLFGRVNDKFTLGRVHDHGSTVGQVFGFGCGNNRHNATSASQNGGVRGRAALRGDNSEGLAHVERRGISGGKIFGDEHERGFALRQARSGSAHKVGDHALSDIMQIGGTLSLIATDGAEHVFHCGKTFEHRTFGGLTLLNQTLDGFSQRRIRSEHGDGLQNRSGLLGAFVTIGGLFGTTVQVGVHQCERLFNAGDFTFGGNAFRTRSIRRFRQWLRHTDDRADCNTSTNANTLDNHVNSFDLFPCFVVCPRKEREPNVCCRCCDFRACFARRVTG